MSGLDTREDVGAAQIEARVLHEDVAPAVEYSIKTTADSLAKQGKGDLKEITETFGDTAYTELGVQRLEQIKENYPDYYMALQAGHDAVHELAETMRPAYTESVWKRGGYKTPGIARQLADRVSEEEKLQAYGYAEQTAKTVITVISRRVNDATSSEAGFRKGLPVDTYRAIGTEIAREIEDGHTLLDHELDAEQIGSLTKGVIASLNAMDQEKRMLKAEEGKGFSVDLKAAHTKQETYDKNK